jgi:hypothetical protein
VWFMALMAGVSCVCGHAGRGSRASRHAGVLSADVWYAGDLGIWFLHASRVLARMDLELSRAGLGKAESAGLAGPKRCC